MTGHLVGVDTAPAGMVTFMTNQTGRLVAGVIALALALAGGVTSIVLDDGDPRSVEEVADAAVAAAEDLDVDEGADLMCDDPTKEQRDQLLTLINAAQREAGTDEPEVDYDVTDVDGETEGSFDVRITSDEKELADSELAYTVLVEEHDGRSCIAGVEVLA
jgi:hypothetical protein